jgi:hypothetical protein
VKRPWLAVTPDSVDFIETSGKPGCSVQLAAIAVTGFQDD